MQQQIIALYNPKMPPPPEVDFAAVLKEVREERGFSQVEMAKRLGVPVRTYRSWEYGQRKPSPEVSFWLAQAHMELKLKKERLKTEEGDQ